MLSPELEFPVPPRSVHESERLPDRAFIARPISVAGRLLRPTSVFETYWCFAAERHSIYLSRLARRPQPWTADPVMAEYRFTNAYRAADRVSQYLIRNVIYSGPQDIDELVFRLLLFRLYNKTETWDLLSSHVGPLTWRDFSFTAYASVLNTARDQGRTLYSAAYVIPPPRLGEPTKCANHLRLLELMMRRSLPNQVAAAQELRDVYRVLIEYPSIGRFLGFQLTIDLNYSSALCFSEMDFVVAGPGASDGIRKCFGPESSGIEDHVIAYVAEHQQLYFNALALDFPGLFGRPLQLVDCQNLFCEVDKYARVAHPAVEGLSGRRRIKQRYRANTQPLSAWFPPRWRLRSSADAVD